MIRKYNTIKLKYDLLMEEMLEKDNKIINLMESIKMLKDKNEALTKENKKLLRNKEGKK